MAKKYIIDLLVNADGSVKSVNGVKGALNSLQQSADKATGGMITKFSNFGKSVLGVTKGLGGTSKALKIFKTALVSTGVGAIVVALGSLVTFLTSTQRGMDKVSKVTAALGAAFDVIRDRISTVGEAFTLLFSGNPSAAFDKLKESVSGVGEEIAKETKAAYQLKEALFALKDEQISLIETDAKRRKSIAENRLIAEDETKSFEDRIKAIDKAAELETNILNDQLRLAKERARISQEQVDLGESTREEIEENARLQAQVSQLEEQSLRQQRTLATRRNALVRQQQAEEDKVANEKQKKLDEAQKKKDEEAAKEIEDEKKRNEELDKIRAEYAKKQQDREAETNLQKVELEKQRALEELERLGATEEQKKQVKDYFKQLSEEARLQDEEKQKELEEKEKEKNLADFEQKVADYEKERQLEKQKIRDKQMVLNAVSQFADAETGIGKALLIAKQALALQETLMDVKRITFKGKQAIAEAGVSTSQNVAESSKIGFPQNLITIAAAIGQGVSIIRSVRSAVSKTKGGASAAAGSASAPSVNRSSAPSSQPPAFNIVGAGAGNQLAEAIGGQSQQPVKAFVVSQDVSTAQSLERNIIEGAKI